MMMKRSLFTLSLLTATFCFGFSESFAQSATDGDGSSIPSSVRTAELLRVGEQAYSVEDIATAFLQNAHTGTTSFYDLPRDSALDFVNLYANYLLKVRAAIDKGLADNPEITKELASTRYQMVADPNNGYLIERKVVDPAVKRIFERRGEELRVAVIFVAMRQNDPADTLRAWKKANTLLEMARSGVDFAQLALDSSDDESTKKRGGEIGWITAGMILRPLEDAAYATQEGQVFGNVIPAPSGYVLLKVLDRDARQRVRPGHIFFPHATTDSVPAEVLAQQALARLRAGDSFEEVAREMSKDRTSAQYGGDLISYYTRSLGFETKNGKLAAELENALFALKDGAVSDLVNSEYGYHIVKRFDTKAPEYATEEKTIREMYKRQFMMEDREAYVDGVLQRQGLSVNRQTLEQLLGSLDVNRTAADSTWASRLAMDLKSMTLFTFQGASYPVQAWIDSVEANMRLRALPLTRENIVNSIAVLMEPAALTEEGKNLEQEYPDFARLMQQYRDGSLIYHLEQEAVYEKIRYDEEQGKKYFESHRNDYLTDPALALTEVYVYTKEEADQIYARAKKGTETMEAIAAAETERQGYRERQGKWSLGSTKHSDLVRRVVEVTEGKLPKKGEILAPFEYQGGWSVVRVDEVNPVRQMTYEEAKGDLMGDYTFWLQKKLQEDLVAELRKKYPVKVNTKALDKALAAK